MDAEQKPRMDEMEMMVNQHGQHLDPNLLIKNETTELYDDLKKQKLDS
jgi:hypothetical protein